ncbi:MAG: Gfo/Idh/MocA family oxidoreductase, partial [Longimicrobiales bacterium]
MRVGVLGLGSIAQVVHLPILSQLPGVEITAVCDADIVKARTIGGRFGARAVRTDAEVNNADDVDALVICTPNH